MINDTTDTSDIKRKHIKYISEEALTTKNDEKDSYFFYTFTLPQNLDIFSNVEKNLDVIKTEDVKHYVLNIIKYFEQILKELDRNYRLLNLLPPFIISQEDDGSIFLEWVFKDFRIGFNIDVDTTKSSWFLITNSNLEELSVSGDISSDDDLKSTIIKIIKYVLQNS